MRRIAQMEPWFGEEEKQALVAYMESGGWLTEFEKTREFEDLFAQYVGSRHCVATNNGTIALTLALMALDVGPRDEVIVPDYTMIASANSVVLAGAKPILVDIDPRDLCLDLTQVESAITSHTKAMIFVSINGRARNLAAAVTLCRTHNLYLVEDAAQSLGSRFGERHLGTLGIVGCFSFSAPKVITTGQGGAVVTDDDLVFERIRLRKDFGRLKGGVDHHEVIGYNFKFTDLQAVIGIEQMKKLPWRVERKKAIYRLYQELLTDLHAVEFISTNLEDVSPWFIDILVEPSLRDQLATFLNKRGVETRPFYPAIHTQPPYRYVQRDFPHSLKISQMGLWLPSSSFLSNQDIERICEIIKEFYA